ncbi:MAG: extensin family protein [Bacteroidota bacterium]
MGDRPVLVGAIVALAFSQLSHASIACAETPPPAARPATAALESKTSSPLKPAAQGADTAKATMPASTVRAKPTRKATSWPKSEIDAASARCQILLNGVDAVVIPAEPMRDGECGAPAPVQLVSIGSNPQIALSPPPTVTCELVAALAKWLSAEVQPAARDLLGGPIIRLEVMSDYSCRNAYARLKARLSQHGRANAVDISRFVTERGQVAEVRTDWGVTERDIRIQIATRDAAARTATAAAGEGAPEASHDEHEATPDGLKGTTAAADTTLKPLDKMAIVPGASLATAAPSFGFGQPSRLGGPRGGAEIQATSRQHFLRRIHRAACQYFGTVLGPEANEAHRNHFHVDMADRPIKSFCE